MRILILGKNGLLGHDLERVFHDHDFFAWDRRDLDITNKSDVFEKLMTVQPDVVLNATGYTRVDDAEKEEELANKINGYSVGILACACREIGATFVHFSTDYVFDGEKKKGYDEESKMNPINAYGRSKALGEMLLTEEMEMITGDSKIEEDEEGHYFIIRTSWLFGTNGNNFVKKILEKAKKGEKFKVVDDELGNPTFSLDLARQTKWLLDSKEYPSGIYHVYNTGSTSWFDYARSILSLSNQQDLVEPIHAEDLGLPARRPKYSILLNTKLPDLRPHKEALMEYLDLDLQREKG
jgi:dTDP-4-dehydrorhamnose reductase